MTITQPVKAEEADRSAGLAAVGERDKLPSDGRKRQRFGDLSRVLLATNQPGAARQCPDCGTSSPSIPANTVRSLLRVCESQADLLRKYDSPEPRRRYRNLVLESSSSDATVTETSPVYRMGESNNGTRMLTEAEFDGLRAELLAQRARARAGGMESLESPVLERLFPSGSDHSLDQYVAKIAAKIGA